MKERVIAQLKKVAVGIIASAMVLGIIPIGMVMRPTTAHAEGEFLRLKPETEAAVSVQLGGDNLIENRYGKGAVAVGEGYDGYMEFNIESILEKDIKDLKEAKFRMIFLAAPGSDAIPVRIRMTYDEKIRKDMEYSERPIEISEIEISKISISPKEDKEPVLVELDILEYLGKWIEDERKSVIFHIDAMGAELGAIYAGNEYQDPLFRPCLKVVTGDAWDQDSRDLRKIYLSEAIYRGSENRSENINLSDGEEGYLRFKLKKENIKGAVYSAGLNLSLINADENAAIKVYLLGEEEKLIGVINDISKENLENIDITDVINDCLASGEEEFALKIRSVGGGISLYGREVSAPKVNMSVSDDGDISAVMEASVNCLGENQAEDKIENNLINSYTDKKEKKATVKWQSEDGILESDGKINNPVWFDDAREISATATITSGDYSYNRSFSLKVLPAPLPDYSGTLFDNMLKVGDKSDEEKQLFESVGTSSDSRFIDGKNFTYRTISGGEMMVVNLKSSPNEQNYLTVKIRAEESFGGIEVASLKNPDAEEILFERPGIVMEGEEGFIYLTYPLPLEYTKDNEFVSLRFKGIEPANLYGVYMTQKPYFEPMDFASMGEIMANGESSAYRLLKKLYTTAKNLFVSEPLVDGETDLARVYTLEDKGSTAVLIEDENQQLAFSLFNGKNMAKIYRETPYYEAYSEAEINSYYHLLAIDCEPYHVFLNEADSEAAVPWKEEGLSGIYKDLISGKYYSFTEGNAIADESVLPEDTEVLDGKELKIAAGETLVLRLEAKPIYKADWRVSKINEKAVSNVKLTRETEVYFISLKNMEETDLKAEKFTVLCGVYEGGMVVDMAYGYGEAADGEDTARIILEKSLSVKPGQTFKVFLENDGDLEEKLELP